MPLLKDKMGKEEVRMGVEWSYLNTLLDYYGQMVNTYSKYLLYLEGLDHKNRKKFFKCALSSFYCSVKAAFDEWLKNEKDKELVKLFETPPEKDEELKEMFYLINIWAQTRGPFATLVKKNDPYNAFKNG